MNRGRGLYLRERDETTRIQRTALSVSPIFMDHNADDTNLQKLNFETQIQLKSTTSWMRYIIFDSPYFSVFFVIFFLNLKEIQSLYIWQQQDDRLP